MGRTMERKGRRHRTEERDAYREKETWWRAGSWDNHQHAWKSWNNRGSWNQGQDYWSENGWWESVTTTRWVYRPAPKSAPKQPKGFNNNTWRSQFHTKDSKWSQRRYARVAAFKARLAKGETPRGGDPSGPAVAGQACRRCNGSRHFALKCEYWLCGVCCHGHPAGPCSWHADQAEQMATIHGKL